MAWGRAADRPHVYQCALCGDEIVLQDVLSVHDGYAIGYIEVSYICARRGEPRRGTFTFNEAALRRLFGGTVPDLPWGAGVSSAPARSVPEAERAALVWAWEVTQLESVDEFLLRCRGPRWKDEEIRREFRERWG
jgi:hypothetical protein